MSAPSDTKAATPATEPSNADVTKAILALAEAIKAGKTDGTAEKLSSIEKFLIEREESRPHENVFNPPMLSHYNPKGDRDFPRTELKCQMYWVGFKMAKENLRQTEIELMNRLEPGNYRVTKADGRSIPFTVSAKHDESGKLDRLSVYFPCKNTEDRSNHLSMESYLREVLGEAYSTESLRAQIESLQTQLQAYAPQGS